MHNSHIPPSYILYHPFIFFHMPESTYVPHRPFALFHYPLAVLPSLPNPTTGTDPLTYSLHAQYLILVCPYLLISCISLSISISPFNISVFTPTHLVPAFHIPYYHYLHQPLPDRLSQQRTKRNLLGRVQSHANAGNHVTSPVPASSFPFPSHFAHYHCPIHGALLLFPPI